MKILIINGKRTRYKLMENNEKSAIELSVLNYIDELKSKVVINMKDLEKFYDLVIRIQNKIEELKKSRDDWKKKYMDLLNTKDVKNAT